MTGLTLPSFLSFFRLSLQESLTIWLGKALNNKNYNKGLEGMSIELSLTHSFEYAKHRLPRGLPYLPEGEDILVRSFMTEAYREIDGRKRLGEKQFKEMLVADFGPVGGPAEADFRLPGHKKENCFLGAHEIGRGSEMDRHIVFRALNCALENDLFPVAINVYLESAMNPEFVSNVLSYCDRHNIKTSDVALELLEHGKAPDLKADFSALKLATRNGVRLALDDVDPREEGHRERLARLGPDCDIIKLDKKVAWAYEKGAYPELAAYVRGIKDRFNSPFIIAEGVHTDSIVVRDMPIDATQKRESSLEAIYANTFFAHSHQKKVMQRDRMKRESLAALSVN
jgi:EAL domain-containing protein (putative c-di-GMP-specific phosphodiesterase class I)